MEEFDNVQSSYSTPWARCSEFAHSNILRAVAAAFSLAPPVQQVGSDDWSMHRALHSYRAKEYPKRERTAKMRKKRESERLAPSSYSGRLTHSSHARIIRTLSAPHTGDRFIVSLALRKR